LNSQGTDCYDNKICFRPNPWYRRVKLSPPVALSAYFLKGVVPEWDLKDIYGGMMQFMVIQVIGLILIILFPQIAIWLPKLIYGK